MTHISIKSCPEDFVVKEVASCPLVSGGDYHLWLLTKRDRNTSELMREISGAYDIPLRNFAYGGRKDRHALTTQYITIRGSRQPAREGPGYSLEFVGLMDRPMGPDLIEKNSFRIVVRKLSVTQAWAASAEIDTVKAAGFPNYFDDQRFGSFDSRQGFLAQKLLLGQYNGALKVYLTGSRQSDKPGDRRRKGFFFVHWKQWNVCVGRALTDTEKRLFGLLVKHSTAFLPALKTIDREELSMFFSAFQGYLWNEVLRRLIAGSFTGGIRKYPGRAGDYLFYTGSTGAGHEFLKTQLIPTPAAKVDITSPLLRQVYVQVLKDNGLTAAMFGRVKLRAAYFKSFARSGIAFPENISVIAANDELCAGRKKMVLTFSLSRGCYATMLIKRLFSR